MPRGTGRAAAPQAGMETGNGARLQRRFSLCGRGLWTRLEGGNVGFGRKGTIMNVWSRLFAALTIFGLALLTTASAGDKDKKDAKDKDAKAEAKDDKKDEKDKKKDEKKKEEVKDEEKVVYSTTADGKIKRFASE